MDFGDSVAWQSKVETHYSWGRVGSGFKGKLSVKKLSLFERRLFDRRQVSASGVKVVGLQQSRMVADNLDNIPFLF